MEPKHYDLKMSLDRKLKEANPMLQLEWTSSNGLGLNILGWTLASIILVVDMGRFTDQNTLNMAVGAATAEIARLRNPANTSYGTIIIIIIILY